MSDAEYRDICRSLSDRCTPAGFDLLQPLCVGWYNRVVAPAYRLPDFGDPRSLAVVIGNTRALWVPFQRAVAVDPTLRASLHPLQEYTTRVLIEAVANLARACEVRYDFEPPPRRVAMQDLAHAAGLAYKSPSYLSVHSTYGPWIALRAVVVTDVPGPSGPAPVLTPPCDCRHACNPRLEEALARSQRASSGTLEGDVEAAWQSWLSIRDACPIGREYRYSDSQIRYHYTKERKWLYES